MHRLSINEISSFRWSFFQDAIKYSSLGCQNIGLWRTKIDEFGYEQAADLLYEMRLNVSSLGWAGGFTGSEGTSYRMAVDDAIEALYQAHMVGAENLIVYPGGRNGHTESHAVRLLATALEELVPIASDLGVRILLEQFMAPRNEANFLSRPELCCEFLSQACPPEVGLVIDLFHVGCSRRIANYFDRIAHRVKLVQLSDRRMRNNEPVRCRLGSGDVPFDAWIERLSDYEGQFEIKLHGYDFENRNYWTELQHSRDFFDRTFRHIPVRSSSD